LKLWEWLRTLLQWLGTDGMSSEDSSIEGFEKVYRVKILIWHRNIDQYLDLIDGERHIPDDKFAEAGSKPIQHIQHSGNMESIRNPASGLPRTLYNEEWLKDVDEYAQLELNVSQEQFQWMNFHGVPAL